MQGRRLKFTCEFRANLESIFSDLSAAVKKGSLDNKSAMSADIVSIGDSWLSSAITGALIEPIQHVEEQDWFKSLGGKWKVSAKRVLSAHQIGVSSLFLSSIMDLHFNLVSGIFD